MLDVEADEYQFLGTIPTAVIESLWPGFAPQDRDVYINPVYLRRHMQSNFDCVGRIAVLNQRADLLASSLTRPYAFARYDKVNSEEAGVNVYVEVPADDYGPIQYLAIGIRLLPAKNRHGKFNHVSTLIPPMSARKMRLRLSKTVWCNADGTR